MSATPPLPFVKMNGLGNEIVVVDLRDSSKVFTPQEVAAVAADRSSRFDQMMVLHAAKTAGTEAYVRIYNADGSEAGACGNGMRCVGWLLAQAVGRNRFQVETVNQLLRSPHFNGCKSNSIETFSNRSNAVPAWRNPGREPSVRAYRRRIPLLFRATSASRRCGT